MLRLKTGLVAVMSLALFACGDDGDPAGSTDATVINIFDAAVPDASLPDAFVCVETDTVKACGTGPAGCVDITSDNQHCGGCDMACPTAGRLCVAGGAGGDAGVAHCECPGDFLTANPVGFGQTFQQSGISVGILGFAGAGGLFHVVAPAWDPANTVLNTDIDLSTVTGLGLPVVAAGYDVDINSMTAQTAYRATEGTMNIEYACTDGIKFTLTDAVFSEVGGLMDPTPVANGCTTSIASMTVTIGTCTPTGADAGPGSDAMPADAGPSADAL
jgi:hypothetical protein